MTSDRDERMLDYILICVRRIERELNDDPQALSDPDRSGAAAILWHLLTLSDATNRLSDDVQQRHPEVDWRGAKRFRDLAAHHYDKLDLEAVEQIVNEDLPLLKAAAASERRALGRE